MVAQVLSIGARALPWIVEAGSAAMGAARNLPTLARVVGAGATGQGGNAVRATSQILRTENAAARVAARRAATVPNEIGQMSLNLEGPGFIPEKLGVANSYAQARTIADNPVFNTAYKTGEVLNKAGNFAQSPAANIALTGAFIAPMFLPQQTQPDPTLAYAPFDNAYTQMPTPSGGVYPSSQRGAEMVGGQQGAMMMDDRPGQPGQAPFGLTDEQIVKAKKRAQETAQLNSLYASTLDQYQMPSSSNY